jgi:hypothetical protein
MSDDNIKIKIQAIDEASSVAAEVAQNIDRELSSISRDGTKAASAFEEIASSIQGIAWDGIEVGSQHMSALSGDALGAASNVGTLTSAFLDLAAVMSKLPMGTAMAGVAGVAGVIGVSAKAALDSYTGTLDEIYKQDGQDIYSASAQAVDGQMFADQQRREREAQAIAARKERMKQEQDVLRRQTMTRNELDKYIKSEQESSAAKDDPLAQAAIATRARIKAEMERGGGHIPLQEQDQMVAAAVEIRRVELEKEKTLERQRDLKAEMADLDRKSVSWADAWIERGMSDSQLRQRDEMKAMEMMLSGQLLQGQYQRIMDSIAIDYTKPDANAKKSNKVQLDLGGGDNSYESRFATRAPGTVSQLDVLKKLLKELQDGNHKQRLEAKMLTDWLERNGIVLGPQGI